MYLLITLQLAGPALREQGTRQIFQSHLCLGTDLLPHFPLVLDQDSVALILEIQSTIFRAVFPL